MKMREREEERGRRREGGGEREGQSSTYLLFAFIPCSQNLLYIGAIQWANTVFLLLSESLAK